MSHLNGPFLAVVVQHCIGGWRRKVGDEIGNQGSILPIYTPRNPLRLGAVTCIYLQIALFKLHHIRDGMGYPNICLLRRNSVASRSNYRKSAVLGVPP